MVCQTIDFGDPVARARGLKYVTVLVRLYLQISGQQPGYWSYLGHAGTRYYHKANSITRNYYFQPETVCWYLQTITRTWRDRKSIHGMYLYEYTLRCRYTTTSLGKLRRIYELCECRRNEIFRCLLPSTIIIIIKWARNSTPRRRDRTII